MRTLWFSVFVGRLTALCSVYSVMSVCSYHQQIVAACPFIFNFDIFYCLLYSLSRFTTNPVIEIWQWRAGLCKEFSAAGQSYPPVKKKTKKHLTVASVGFSYDLFFFPIVTPLHPLLTVKKETSCFTLVCLRSSNQRSELTLNAAQKQHPNPPLILHPTRCFRAEWTCDSGNPHTQIRDQWLAAWYRTPHIQR